MRYIDEKGKKIEIDISALKYFNSGHCAKVYRNKDEIVKQYYAHTYLLDRLKINVFNILKQIDHPNFIKLYKAYMTRYKNLLINRYYIDMYTAKYYKKEDIIPTFINKDYLLDNINNMENLFQIFSDNKIKADDVRVSNVVFTKESIIIIDPDFYKTSKDTRKNIENWNKKILFELFKEILLAGLKNGDRTSMYGWIYDTFKINEITERTDLAHELSKKLKYVKRPIDVIRK